MERKGLQELVKSVFSDERIYARFKSDPQSIISNYKLTSAERKAVLNPRVRMALIPEGPELFAESDPLNNWF